MCWRHRQLDRLERKLEALTLLVLRGQQREKLMAKVLSDVLADITAQTTVIAGVKTATDAIIAQEQAIKAQLDAAIASNDPAQIQAAADALEANTANLQAVQDAVAKAVAANTVAAPPTP